MFPQEVHRSETKIKQIKRILSGAREMGEMLLGVLQISQWTRR